MYISKAVVTCKIVNFCKNFSVLFYTSQRLEQRMKDNKVLAVENLKLLQNLRPWLCVKSCARIVKLFTDYKNFTYFCFRCGDI